MTSPSAAPAAQGIPVGELEPGFYWAHYTSSLSASKKPKICVVEVYGVAPFLHLRDTLGACACLTELAFLARLEPPAEGGDA